MMVIWIIATIYLIGVLVSTIFFRRSGESIFQGDDFSDYAFLGFVGIFWFLFLPPIFIGKIAALLGDWKKH